jgi:hypothetical protein
MGTLPGTHRAGEEQVKRLIALVAATAILAFAASSTASAQSSAKPKSPTLAQFNALSKKVTKLQKRVTTLENLMGAAFAYDVCLTAATADAFQGTWIFADKGMSTPTFPATSTGAAVNDLKACDAFQIPRQLPSTDAAPSNAVFQALINIFS